MFLTFIVEASKTLYRRNPIGTVSLSRIAILFNKLVSKTPMGSRTYFWPYKALV
ncbi:MAG: hypothetical protein ACMUEL_07315 [Flavobacteriales bacterium Tduv]